MKEYEADKILMVGDIHGDWESLNQLIAGTKPNIIIQVGDFGYWPHMDGSSTFSHYCDIWKQNGIENGDCKIFWCDGNHENHDVLDLLVSAYGKDDPIEVMNNVFYMPRMSTIKINDEVFLFIGGADSIDKQYRIKGISWWEQETIKQKDIYNLPNIDIVIVISHTCPMVAFEHIKPFYGEKKTDPSCIALQTVFSESNPNMWFFGHFHKENVFDHNECQFYGLGMPRTGTRWWCEYVQKIKV